MPGSRLRSSPSRYVPTASSRACTYVWTVDREQAPQPEGQTSINDMLDEPVGAAPIQMVLPIHL